MLIPYTPASTFAYLAVEREMLSNESFTDLANLMWYGPLLQPGS
jgi:hypothetical protein